MKISYEWIKEYVDISASPDELASGLTMSGSEVGSIHDAGTDKIMELEITSNRPDCLNMLGMAREAAVIFDTDLTAQALRSNALSRTKTFARSILPE